jgi:predicted CoA-binding protein
MSDWDAVIRSARTIAVVGLSSRERRPSHGVAAYLQGHGYLIVPVNPNELEVLGETAYPTLAAARDAVGPIDIVDIFRRSSVVGTVVDEAIAIKPRLIWLQIGVVDHAAAERARAAAIPLVMDRCLAVDHSRLISQ